MCMYTLAFPSVYTYIGRRTHVCVHEGPYYTRDLEGPELAQPT